MADIKDILGVPRAGLPAAEKAEKPKLERPKGMSREAFALLSGSHPLVPSQLVGELNKKSDLQAMREKQKQRRGQVTFQWRQFTNPARSDGLELAHWVKCYKDAAGNVTPADPGEYPFAKYNKQPALFRYNDDEWANLVDKDKASSSEGWAREETDYLLGLCEAYSLRWLVIHDRYDYPGGAPRTLEQLKARYYGVARALLVGRAGGPEPVANHVLVRHPFSADHEAERKKGLELLFKRSPEEDAEEDVVLREAAAIQLRRRQEAAAKRPAPATMGGPAPEAAAAVEPPPVSEFAAADEKGVPPLFEAGGVPAPSKQGRVAARVAHTKELIEAVVNGLGKVQQAVKGSMSELKMAELPRGAGRAACGAYLALLGEVSSLMDLKRTLAAKQAAVAGAKRAKRPDEDYETPRAEKRQRVAKKFADD